MFILKNDIKKFEEIPQDIPEVFTLPSTALEYTNLLFFKN
jgi:hypothetical protein